MVIIGIEAEKDPILIDVFKNIIDRGKSDSLLKNPFKINCLLQVKKKVFFLLNIKPIYPPIFYFGFLLLVPFIVFSWFNLFLILPLLLISIGFLWSFPFYWLILRAAIRKKGYKGKYYFLNKNSIIKRLAKWHK